MAAIGAINSVALQILSQPLPRAAGATSRAAQPSITTMDLTAAGKSKIANVLFDVSTPSVNQLKVDIFKRTGEALGIEEKDFASTKAYGAALSEVVATLKSSPNAKQIITSIEKKLGLDKLGVSLETVIDAIVDPSSGADDELNQALERQLGAFDGPASTRAKRPHIQSDELGLYRAF